MGKLSTREFEGVLHPIFQEDELTLIVAGGVLGLLAGGYQAWIFIRGERKRKEERLAARGMGGTGAAAAAMQAPEENEGDWW